MAPGPIEEPEPRIPREPRTSIDPETGETIYLPQRERLSGFSPDTAFNIRRSPSSPYYNEGPPPPPQFEDYNGLPVSENARSWLYRKALEGWNSRWRVPGHWLPPDDFYTRSGPLFLREQGGMLGRRGLTPRPAAQEEFAHGGQMTIGEPSTVVGDYSGEPYARLAEGGQPEQVTVTPLAPPSVQARVHIESCAI